MKNETITFYRNKVDGVLNYIHHHLNENITVKELAEYAGISFFHFHRILKGALKEPLGSYIDKIRLDTAVKLMRYSDDPINRIAIKIGYNDISSFSKAFSKAFGISPQEFKMNTEIILNTKIDYRIDAKGKLVADIAPKIIFLTGKKIIYIRVKGEYGGREVNEAWEQLINFVKNNHLLGWKPDFFSIYYDDPDDVGKENCTTDLCFACKKEIDKNAPFKSTFFAGGKYAVFRYKGPYERLWELYNTIYGEWLIKSDYKLRDVPSVEKYIHFSSKIKPEDLLTEIYIPIE